MIGLIIELLEVNPSEPTMDSVLDNNITSMTHCSYSICRLMCYFYQNDFILHPLVGEVDVSEAFCSRLPEQTDASSPGSTSGASDLD